MGDRWFVLLALAVSVSIQCYQVNLEDGTSRDHVIQSEQLEVDIDDDLEDLDDGLETSSSPSFASEVAMVASVTEYDVQRVLSRFDYVLLLGYAPWCTQSQALLPQFAAAAARLSRLGNRAVLAKLDAVHSPHAAKRYGIRGFPTLLFFARGAREEYLGGHSRDEIVLWVRKRTGFSVSMIQSKDEAEEFLRKKVTAVLGYFSKLEGPEHDAFIAAAKTEAETEFVVTSDPEVALMFINPPLIAVTKQEPELFSAFGGSFNTHEISAFVELNKRPLLTLLNSKNANIVYSSPLKLHIMLFADSKDYERVKPLYLKAATELKGKVMFLVIDLEDEDFSKPMLGAYGLDTGKPVVVGLNYEDGSRYHLESDLTYEHLKEFAADLYAGKLRLYFKSEPISTENDGLVKRVVGKNVEEVVMDDTKDVFLYVYAPWCVSCEKVGQVFEKLAKRVRQVPSLVMAKYDAQANEHPLLLEVPHYPSLLLYPAGRKSSEPIVAKAGTSWKKLLAFVKENVAIPFPVLKTVPNDSNGAKAAAEVEIPSVESPAPSELVDAASVAKEEL